jgi:hypothetical protein
VRWRSVTALQLASTALLCPPDLLPCPLPSGLPLSPLPPAPLPLQGCDAPTDMWFPSGDFCQGISCVNGNFSDDACSCTCIAEFITNQPGWCVDPETKACTVAKVWSNDDKAFACPGEYKGGWVGGCGECRRLSSPGWGLLAGWLDCPPLPIQAAHYAAMRCKAVERPPHPVLAPVCADHARRDWSNSPSPSYSPPADPSTANCGE